MKFVSDKDREDIEFGLSQDIDFIAASFTRSAQDVRDIKEILKAHGKEDVEIICKIENMEGVNNVQEILDEANGIMVARGDLGVEVPFEELPEIQKSIIKTCISRGKRVVTATSSPWLRTRVRPVQRFPTLQTLFTTAPPLSCCPVRPLSASIR